jgi:glycosyltransferase involved in cell wall biosynthesis
MNILYHVTIPPPEMPECDAVLQEIEVLQAHFGGDIVYLNPNRRPPLRLPRVVFGIQKLSQVRNREPDLDIHHLFNPDLFPFPVLHALRRPIIYSLTGGVEDSHLDPRRRFQVFNRATRSFLASLAAITVGDERSLDRLRSWGLDNVTLVHPGVDTTRFTCSPLPLQSEIKLMVGSAPWTLAQFQQKGIEALLAAAQRRPRLRLVFLWRGVLADEMERRVHDMHLEKQVKVLNKRVNVNEVLAEVHASIALATDPAIIRPYPHSLMESLAAGKPVVVSRCIAMTDYVEQTGCGKIVEGVNPSNIIDAIEALAREYKSLQRAAQQVGQRDFSQQATITSFHKVYDCVLESRQMKTSVGNCKRIA